MMKIESILCPIDFSAISSRELDLAVAIGRAFGARLVLNHNVAAAAPGFAKSWEWEEAHQASKTKDAEARQRLDALLKQLPADVRTEGVVTSGPLASVLLAVAENIGADLILLGSHGWSTPEHVSVSERIIERSPCPVLTIQEGKGEERAFSLSGEGDEPARVAVPTDLSTSSLSAVRYAFALARVLPIRLHLYHALPGSPTARHEARRSMKDLIPEDLTDRVRCVVGTGNAADEILGFVERLDPAFIVMGEHAQGIVRRFFTHDTASEILHRAKCPVWFVPAGYEPQVV